MSRNFIFLQNIDTCAFITARTVSVSDFDTDSKGFKQYLIASRYLGMACPCCDVTKTMLMRLKIKMVDSFLISNGYFAGFRTTVGKCIILDYYVAV